MTFIYSNNRRFRSSSNSDISSATNTNCRDRKEFSAKMQFRILLTSIMLLTIIAPTIINLLPSGVEAFSVIVTSHRQPVQQQSQQQLLLQSTQRQQACTQLYMSSTEKITTKTTKKGTQVMDKTETKVEEKKDKEEMWRVVLHNDEVHTFNYVVRSLTKVIGILDRKAAFEICVQTHGIGKATITKTWKKQAEQFCLGLQRQGLTVSISPDEDFEGGHSGGGL
jgi:ATP-dependent Clp protease adapter protein ClpS